MTGGEITLAIISALLGGGGLGAVIVNAIANRKKTKAEGEKIAAECMAILGETYEKRMAAMLSSIERLDKQVEELKDEKRISEDTIDTLKRENAELKLQVEEYAADVDKLTKAVKSRDKRITELEKHVAEIPALERHIAELSARLDSLNGDSDGPSA
ncbi:MAG: hypothetical protein WC319_16020 [Candidatus Paceibacterota bacterium]|jgi:predicted RNase H-like nuclease (RuvC/YqgF family)